MASAIKTDKLTKAIKKLDLTKRSGKTGKKRIDDQTVGEVDRTKRKVIVMGLDCATPQLVFNEFKSELPNISKLIDNGVYGPMRSTIPPITIPAWLCMTTGKSPGRLGLYGFKHRKHDNYDNMWIANATAIKFDTVWKILDKNNKKSILVGIPPSFPPYKINGSMIGCFLTPDINSNYTYPPELKDEIAEVVGEYIPDVKFRTENKDELLEELNIMTEKRFKLIKHLIQNKPWDFFMFVEIGLDRIHHGFWKYFDQEHHLYEKGNPYEDSIKNYYLLLDKKVGELLELLDDDTIVLVVSDHGAKRMKGALCINEWMMEEGYLVTRDKPDKVMRYDKLDIDWSRTKAWGWGGYYSRVFLNVKGREPQGTIDPKDYETERDTLIERLKAIPDIDGNKMATQVYKPEELYDELNGDYPDLMVFFDDLHYRAAGTVGHGSKYLLENDTGPDDAVHDWSGIFIGYDKSKTLGRRLEGLKIYDVAATILELFKIPLPDDIDGKPIKIE
jgi:predicted AlkP superfamily phosphohydrolase/phosphomutase